MKAPVDSGFKVDLGFNVALWVPRRAARAPWGLPTPDLRSTLGQRSVNVGSTFGQRWVMSLAISARFSLILLDSQMKVRDLRHFFPEMVDFPIRKRHFRVRGWSGAFWEPLERKKRQNQMYLYAPVGG